MRTRVLGPVDKAAGSPFLSKLFFRHVMLNNKEAAWLKKAVPFLGCDGTALSEFISDYFCGDDVIVLGVLPPPDIIL